MLARELLLVVTVAVVMVVVVTAAVVAVEEVCAQEWSDGAGPQVEREPLAGS
jgi:hypothetical protein